jgi:hypothetical protein
MADPRRFELDELLIRPGTYFNPQTEVLVVVDDSPDLDNEIFNMENYEGDDWVLISDELAVDEHRRDELIEGFQVRYHPGAAGSVTDDDTDDDALEDDHQEVGREDLDDEESDDENEAEDVDVGDDEI